MKNFKLFLKSLFSNDAAIDGARKKPWYAALIIFFISIILSVVPSTVLELRKQGDKNFDSTTFLFTEAAADFSEELQKSEYDGKMIIIEEGKEKLLQGDEKITFKKYYDAKQQIGYVFQYSLDENVNSFKSAFNDANLSYVIFTKDSVYIQILDPNTPKASDPLVVMTCTNAYKKLDANAFRDAFVSKEVAKSKDESIKQTWSNWKVLIRKLYNQTRLIKAGSQLAIISIVNSAIVLIMGFMVWILTRGKNNPYRLFSVWDSFKISFWASMSPALLTCGLGFLISNFASTLFPLLLGVRVMWLSMKSLRPDGSGYAAN